MPSDKKKVQKLSTTKLRQLVKKYQKLRNFALEKFQEAVKTYTSVRVKYESEVCKIQEEGGGWLP